jgi:type IV pilus biogenesis protein CpaD/CtpE
MKLNSSPSRNFTLLATIALLSACATPPREPVGAIVPMAGGQIQSVVKAEDKAVVLKIFDQDAKLTCERRNPAKAGRYAVVSQTVEEKSGAMKAENKNVEVAANLALRYLRLDRGDNFTATTVFTCE